MPLPPGNTFGVLDVGADLTAGAGSARGVEWIVGASGLRAFGHHRRGSRDAGGGCGENFFRLITTVFRFEAGGSLLVGCPIVRYAAPGGIRPDNDHFRHGGHGRAKTVQNDMNISVLIADDHNLLAEALALHLCAQGDFVTETVGTLEAALERIVARGGYDVVLLDLMMPGMNGLDGLERVIAANDGRPVVLLSGNLAPATVTEAMRRGAASCLPKTTAPQSLVNVVRFVASGETFLPAMLPDSEAELAADEAGLTPRERRVLRELCSGLTNKEIGRLLSLSEVTIKMHVRSIFSKLGAKNRTHAAMIANERGLN